MTNIEILDYTNYVTQERDTFDLIAYKQYGNELLASLLIQENIRYADVLLFEEGILLKIPVINEAEVDDSLPPWRKGEINEDDL
ncbi:LysM domain-containing protein [bacterium 210820-DFI.6.37]|nr:LysM domain-containing protein [bacterium 210820-DFI.6.37]